MEKPLTPMSVQDIENSPAVEFDIIPEGESLIEVEIETVVSDDFSKNLVEDMDPQQLQSLSQQLQDDIRIDKSSRRDWEKTLSDGLELLGLKIEERTEPWQGACGIYHSMLTESIIKFQSEMIMETFPANGPVLTKIIGKDTKEKMEAAARVKDDMNDQLTDKMPEFRPEHERMLWNLGFSGAAFKKVYYDPALGRQVSMFVAAEDVLLPYGASELSLCPRVTQVMKKTESEINRLVADGFYIPFEFGEPGREINEIEKAKERLSGVNAMEDNRYTLYEMTVDLDLPGFEDEKDGEPTGVALPYVVTMDSSGTICAIYRNYKQDDELKKKRQHFVGYTMIPGFGPYGFGYVHILGGYAKGATSIMRQLVDAGTLANLPGGLKARGLRIKGDDTPIAPGEWRDVDVPAGTIRDNLVNLPYKEPSQTLLMLFKEIVDEGRMLASTADMKVADMNQQAPVGTTLAIIERMMKVMSAVQARIHASMKKEFGLLRDIIRDYTPDEYDYETDAGRKVKKSDYDHCDIIPVSDPNASSSAQRMAQYQAALQLSQSAPQLYDLPMLHRETLRVLGLKNASEIVPDKDNMKPKDPVTENMNILNGKPVKAFIYQDHDAHLAVHLAAAQDPNIQQLVGQNPMVNLIQQSLQAHLMEHMAFKYRNDIAKQMGVPLPKDGDDLDEQMELDVSRLAAEAAPLVLQLHSKKAAQEAAMQQQQDPTIQAQQQELALKAQKLQQDAQESQAELALKAKTQAEKVAIERERIASQERIAGAQIGSKSAVDNKKLETEQRITGFKAGIDLRKPR
jgi:hypothetical protein